MEKKEQAKRSFASGPWTMKEKEYHDFIPVTELNRKTVIVLGRILYYIKRSGKTFTYTGCITVDPCFTKGWWRYPFMPWERSQAKTHWRVFFPEDMDYDRWVTTNKYFINNYIENQTIFFRPNDPILQFYKE